MAFEIEAKYAVSNLQAFRDQLNEIGARAAGQPEQHADTYFAHPCRDFVETKEALRIRRVDGQPSVTYKGPKLPGTIKARRELEWSLAPGDEDGSKMTELLAVLGFRRVAEVRKRRQNYRLEMPEGLLGLTVDEVANVGNYAEIEAMVDDESDVDEARQRIARIAQQLGLRESEPRSYLRMLLEGTEADFDEKR